MDYLEDLNHHQSPTQSLKLSFIDFVSGHKELKATERLSHDSDTGKLCQVLVGCPEDRVGGTPDNGFRFLGHVNAIVRS